MEAEIKGATLKKVAVHYVGSKNNLEPLHLATEAAALHEESLQLIGAAFLSRFTTVFEKYSFHHATSLQFNEVYNYAANLFLNRENFTELTANIARHLYESSTHPKVKGGELYACFFEGLPVESRICTAIGLFKTENKTQFLESAPDANRNAIQLKDGVEPSKMDKGCLIINTNKEAGFDVLIFDAQNRGEEALYWKETFLALTQQKNDYHHTAHLLTLTKQYITGPLEEDFGLDKTGQIGLLSKSIEYFKTNETFDIEDFQTQVFGDEERIDGFRNFGSRYIEQHDYDISASFDISQPAVKKQSRIFKSVLKLDRNFHIYIHGNTDLIEKGMDENGRKFYKLYYQEEE